MTPTLKNQSADVPPMRVLHIVESSGGGTGRHVLDLAEGMIARGFEVHLAYSTLRMDQIFRDRLAGIRGLHAIALDMRIAPHPRDFGVVRTVRRYLRQHGPFDVIHGHSSKGGAIARLAAMGKRVRAFYTLHGLIMMDPGLARWKRKFYQVIEVALSLRTSRIIAVSPEEARAAVGVGLGRSRVVTIPNGIAPLDLTPRAEARRTMRVGDDALVIGFIGRLVDQKAPDVLIKAFATTVKKAPHARLAMVGGGPLDNQLHELAWSLGVADKVIWLGERDARGVLAGFDLFALSSRKEGLPYVVLEAMVTGLPVVATSSSGVEILVESGVNGAVIAPGDHAAFARALIALAGDPMALARCGRASRRRAAELTVEAMVEATIDAYAGVHRPAAPRRDAPTKLAADRAPTLTGEAI